MRWNKELQTIEDVASYLQISVSALYTIRIDDRLSFPKKIKIGNKVMFDPDQVKNWLESIVDQNN